jgi:hypothetical protein
MEFPIPRSHEFTRHSLVVENPVFCRFSLKIAFPTNPRRSPLLAPGIHHLQKKLQTAIEFQPIEISQFRRKILKAITPAYLLSKFFFCAFFFETSEFTSSSSVKFRKISIRTKNCATACWEHHHLQFCITIFKNQLQITTTPWFSPKGIWKISTADPL